MCVNAVLASDSQIVIDDIIPLVNSQNSYIQNRALEILSLSDGDVVAPFVQQVLSDATLTNEKAVRISSIALYNNKETAIDEIINIAAQGNANPQTSATMLYELSKNDDLGVIFEKCATSSNATNTSDMLKELANQAGVPRIIATALSSQSNEIVTSISFALATHKHSVDTFVEILNSISETDDSSSSIYSLAGRLIYDPVLSGISQAIIATDAQAMNAALAQVGVNPTIIGEALSQTSQNATIANRLDTMLSSMDSFSARSTMIILAHGQDSVYPKLVWDRYISTNAELSTNAMDVILEVTSAGIKFNYAHMDFLPYADKLIQDLNSANSTTNITAIQILNKIPEGVEHHEFYQRIYAGYPQQSVFSILCWHYVGEGAMKLDLQLKNTTDIVEEISYDIKSIKVKNIKSRDFIDYDGIIKQNLTALGLKIVDNASVKLVITINEDPISKSYRGIIGSSYLGAKCTTQIEVYIAGQKVDTVSGYFEILPPTEKPVDDNVSKYKDDPTDAPLESPFITSYIQALYRAFGPDVLYGTYQYDRLATLSVGKELWE